MAAEVAFTVFTKPWLLELAELGRFVAAMGFDGIELPVRPGFQVTPEAVERDLPAAARLLGDFGVRIASVAGPVDRRTIAACAEAGVPLIRICVDIPPDRGYLEHEATLLRTFSGLVPALSEAGVALGVQNHCDRCVGSALGLRRLVEPFDPRVIGAVWDPAHCALAGEIPSLAADILWSHLRLVNLKNVRWREQRHGGVLRFHHAWVPGPEGLCRWDEVAVELDRRGYRGDICLTAEYSEPHAVDHLIASDLAYAHTLFRQREEA